MYYLRFTKSIIHHFISKDKSISMRNRMFMHTARDDSILSPMRFVSRSDDFQVYGARLPKRMTNQPMRDSDAYKTYLAYATGAESPKMKRKLKKHASPSKSKRDTTIHQAGGSSEGADFESKVPDKPKGKSIDTSKGTGLKPGVPDVSTADSSKSDNESWGDSGDEANEQSDDEDEQKEETPDDESVYTYDDYVPTDEETKGETDDVTKEEYERINEELYGNVNVSLTDDEPADKEKYDKEMTVAGHVNVNQEDAGNQVKDDAHATQKTEGPIPSSFISSDYAAKYLNFDNIPSVDTKVVSMLDTNIQHEVLRTSPLFTISVFVIPEHTVANPPEIVATTSSITISTLMSSLFPHLQQLTPISTPITTEATTSTTTVSDSETLAALQLRVTNLEKDVKELKDVDNSKKVISTIQSEVPKAVNEYLGSSLDDAMHKVIQKNVADIIKEHSVPAETLERLRQQYAP
ncbi:hypothetical protein Tco_1420518 [Tanacetum coccineum]